MSQYCRELEEEIMYLQKALLETTNPDDIRALTEDLEDLKAALKYATPLFEEIAMEESERFSWRA